MLKLNDWSTSSNKYPERVKELTPEIILNAEALLQKVNHLLTELGIDDAKVSSGFRPAAVNANIPGAAKKSAHMSGKAIDLVDNDGKIKALVQAKPKLLRELGLFMEDAGSTPTWVHLDCLNRTDRPSRTFKP